MPTASSSHPLISEDLMADALHSCHLLSAGAGSIREIKKLVDLLQDKSGIPFIRMEMGIPGLPTPSYIVEAEIAALRQGVSAQYPHIEGLAALKQEAARFIKLFLNTDLSPQQCVPTVGSMNGAYASFMVAGRRSPTQDTVLFIDPGFPVHKQIVKMIGLKQENFDFYHYRGEKLRDRLEKILQTKRISMLLYSNPNNPTWACFTEKELEIIGELATKYDCVVAEDLAYLGMDFRHDYSRPGHPLYQPTIARYTENYMLFISCSKILSYAGQRIGLLAVSPSLYEREFPCLLQYFNSAHFGHALIYGCLYATTSGVTHSAQHALAHGLKLINDGTVPFLQDVKAYATKAKKMKKIFIEHGFYLVYATDGEVELADGFYFTVGYEGMTGTELVTALLRFGVSAISLLTTGSEENSGIRTCVSLIKEEEFPVLAERLENFHAYYSHSLK
jgi:aspartate/methionine/tyrosine aminotransferase